MKLLQIVARVVFHGFHDEATKDSAANTDELAGNIRKISIVHMVAPVPPCRSLRT